MKDEIYINGKIIQLGDEIPIEETGIDVLDEEANDPIDLIRIQEGNNGSC
jgi:hypothetical protein